LAFGAIPGLAVFYLRRQIAETPRFVLAKKEAEEQKELAEADGHATGIRGVLADRKLLRWLIGASLAWFLFDFVYYGNTISTPLIVSKVAPNASLIGQVSITLAIFSVAALPAYFLAAATIDRIGRKVMQAFGFTAVSLAFFLIWAIPSATTDVVLFLVLFGATYFFSEFGPNTTTFVYPAEIFPVQVRTTSHGIAAASGKIGAFIGTYALTTLISSAGLPRVSLLVAFVAGLGALVTVWLLPEPKGKSLEELTETSQFPTSAAALGIAESRGIRTPAA
jgi:MFS transporter, PHS family, inorganic phosphate transporter